MIIGPSQPWTYPTVIDNDAVSHEHQMAKHEAGIIKYETYLRVKNFLQRTIVKAIDHEWIADLENKTLGFNHVLPKDLMTHL